MPRKTLAFIGIILVLVALSGLPQLWKTVYSVVAGIIVVFLAFRDKNSEYVARNNKSDNNEPELSSHDKEEKV